MNENSTLLFALSASGGLKSFEIPVGEEELQDQVQAWRFAMNAGAQARGDSDEKKSAGDKSLQVKAREIDEETRYSRLLYDELIDPVEKAGLFGINYQSHGARNLKKRKSLIKRLVIVSDGCLLSLPFAALKDKEGRRLIQKHPISSAISLGSLLWPAKKKKSVEILLSAADPMRTKAETFRTARGRVPMPSAVAMNSSSEFNSTWRGSYLPLRYAYEEGRAIALLFDGALFVSGPLAQKRTLLENLPKYRILHFATHGYLNATDGLQSGLIFAPDVDQSEGGRILVAGEIVNLPLSAEMSVLSGCHTAEGQLSGGEGMLGLAWAFRAAGCPAVVASQWAVDDRATRILMVAFYRQLKLGVPKDIALQRAIASVALEFPEPYFWASFQILGDRNQLFPSQSAGSAIRR